MNQLQIRNFEIQQFVDFIMKHTLKGKQSLARTRFIRLLAEQIKAVEEERIAMAERHADKNEDGSSKTETLDNGTTQYIISDIEAFNQEYVELMNQSFTIDCTPERQQMLEVVRDIVLETELEFSGSEAMLYDRWAEIVEAIEY